MKILKKFENFFIDKILEGKFELSIGISKRLEYLLKKIDHDISRDLLALQDDTIKSDKITLIDYDEDDNTKFTYTIPNKIVDLISKRLNKSREESIGHLTKIDSEKGNFIKLSRNTPLFWGEFRVSASIPKVIEKVFPGKYDASKGENSRESFKNLVVAKRKKDADIFNNFKIVDGHDIVKYYDERSYDSNYGSGGSLLGSCMRYDYCGEYIEFYSNNKGVKLVVLMSDEHEDMIIGRALLWDIVEIDGEEVDRKFMDRIYTIKQEDVHLFKDYAKENGWLHKKDQNMFKYTNFVDTISDEVKGLKLKTSSTFSKQYTYPYMDTMKYFYYKKGYLTNYEIDNWYYYLEDTDGGYYDPIEDKIYVEYYDRHFYEYDNDLIWCSFGEEYRLIDDAIFMEHYQEYTTKEYAENNLIYSEEMENYYKEEDVVWSDYHDSYIPKNESLEIYIENSSDEELDEILHNPHYMDYIIGESITVFEYYKHNMHFLYNTDNENFIFC
ncbi:MAG: hypothetical protein ACOC2W_04715, partial [bacterium]